MQLGDFEKETLRRILLPVGLDPHHCVYFDFAGITECHFRSNPRKLDLNRIKNIKCAIIFHPKAAFSVRDIIVHRNDKTVFGQVLSANNSFYTINWMNADWSIRCESTELALGVDAKFVKSVKAVPNEV